MNYAEAVNHAESAIYDAIDHKFYSKGEPDLFRDALSVLHRAGKVMEKVEGAGTEAIQAEIDYQEIDDAPEEVVNILRAALACREEK